MLAQSRKHTQASHAHAVRGIRSMSRGVSDAWIAAYKRIGMGRRPGYGCLLGRVRCQANGLAYASTMGWMQVEPQLRNAHPTEEQGGSMDLPT